MKFHHIGIACYDIEESSQFYIAHGYTKTETVYDPIQNVNICFCKNLTGEGTCVELISPKDETSPVCKNLQKNGVSPYHICYETSNLETTVSELKKQKFLMVSKPAPAVAFGGKRVCFLFSKNVGLIELVETGVCE
ncbi:MAG: VOC family protein [Spirochaetaceae bacterium]|nr:VOC family protein [Spirochaetaceae bacterium]